ncbi:helix-turn-helix transcriptional regulator [Glaciihabitans sp. dw_435]|uniref:ArsR/SmtB family transcription factor n=1 Tax=Glaciihabitans sp. dw_435 TaxID=2720081 RepID=UPI001BD522CA|nr:helix-turn-helix transcriptional regulator [Glaciihabitans sp. dw_435]
MSTEYPTPATAELQLVDVLRALADPVRLDVVRLLGDGMAHCKGREDWNFGVQKSTMSHHLRILREAGVTDVTIDGRDHWIRLRREDLEARFPGLITGVLSDRAEG